MADALFESHWLAVYVTFKTFPLQRCTFSFFHSRSHSSYRCRFVYLPDVGVRIDRSYSVCRALQVIHAKFPVCLFDIIILENGLAWLVVTSKQLCACLCVRVCVCARSHSLCLHCGNYAHLFPPLPLFSHFCNTEHTLNRCVCSFVCVSKTVMDSECACTQALSCTFGMTHSRPGVHTIWRCAAGKFSLHAPDETSFLQDNRPLSFRSSETENRTVVNRFDLIRQTFLLKRKVFLFFGPRMNHPVTNTSAFHRARGFSRQTGRFSSLELNLHHSWLQSQCESPSDSEFYDGCLSGIPVELSSLHGQEGRRVVAAFFHQTGGPQSSTMYLFLNYDISESFLQFTDLRMAPLPLTEHTLLAWYIVTSAYPGWTGVRGCRAGNQRYSPVCTILPTTQWILRWQVKQQCPFKLSRGWAIRPFLSLKDGD